MPGMIVEKAPAPGPHLVGGENPLLPRGVVPVMKTLTATLWLASLCPLSVSAAVELKPCERADLPADARCAKYEVFENRTTRAGRKIALQVVVLPAKEAPRLPDPVVYFAGGPGAPSIPEGVGLINEIEGLRKRRDVLLVDFRGTGESAPLNCPGMQGTTGAQGFLDQFMPADKMRACWDALAKERDLAQYRSDTAVDDVEEVRQALGYGKVNLMGGSYGTRAAMVYLRRHPESVRTATLMGVYPTQEKGPLNMAKSAQGALDGLVAECAADAACHGAFPKLTDEIAAVLARAEREPMTVELSDPETGKPIPLRLNRNGVAQTLRYMLYVPMAASQLPLNVHLAAQGDFKPLAETAFFFAANLTALSDGFYLSVTCAEELPHIREAEIAPAIAGTFLDDFRIRQQQAACKAWPVPPASEAFLDAVRSDVPTLMLSGERDPVTPKSDGDLAGRTLSKSRHFVVPDGAHSLAGLSGLECVNGMIEAFVESGSTDGLDASCLAKVSGPPFGLTREEEIKVAAADLDRLTGTYGSRELGFQVAIERAGERLRATVAGQPPLLLVPLSLTRFRLEGLPPGFVLEFQLADGRATAATFQEPGQPAQTLTRQ